MKFPDFKNELLYSAQGFLPVGCDEVGVAPLAGPVVAAACMLDKNSIGKYRSKTKWYARVRDSKTTNEEEREILLQKILPHCIAYGVGEVWPEEIDKLNIHHASRKAMKLAVEQLISNLKDKKTVENKKIFIIIDGRFKIPDIEFEQKTVVKGDLKVLSIAAASIIAKVHRDNIMRELDQKFPNYGFKNHKGYGTKQHYNAIEKHGICDIHRRSFVKQ